MSSLRQWLAVHGLAEHADLLERNDVELDLLPQLNELDLEKLGLSLGQRKRMMRAFASLGASAAAQPVGGDTAMVASEDHGAAPMAPTQVERRRLTVMFCDLVGSTALSERLDPEDLRNLMQSYQRTCGAIIARHDGHVAQYLGDGLMIYFGWPKAHEDDAERSVRAALEIIDQVKTIHAPLPLTVRVGIATGPVVVGDTGGGDASIPKTAIGPTPNVAARLQALAQPDQIVIATSTRRLLGHLYAYEDLGEQALKGLSSPVRAWRVTGARGEVSRFDAMRGADGFTDLIGRDDELGLLQARWQLARQGQGQAVLVRGEPGIGKSRLIRALRDHVAADAPVTLRYDCAPHFRNSAFYPVTEQLRRAAGLAPDDTVAVKLDKLQAMLALSQGDAAESLALLAPLLNLPLDGRVAPVDMTPQLQRQQTHQALEDMLVGLARHQPLLLLVEDAHWADPSTLEFLGRLLERIAQWSMMAVITFRPVFEAPWPPHPHVADMMLSRLGREDSMRLMRDVADHKALPAVLLEQIAAKTDGVPLFVEELTKTLLEAGILRDEGDRYVLTGSPLQIEVPNTLHDSLMERLDHLGAVKDIAQTCAAIGREFSFDFLQAVSSSIETRLRDALAQLSEAGLIYGLPDAPTETYAFKHALVQEVAYSTLLRQERQSLHGRIALTLEQRLPETATTHPELLAHHHSEAGNKVVAIGFSSAAGMAALQRSSYVETIAHARQALGWLDAIADPAERTRAELSLNGLITPAMMVHYGYASEELERVTQRSMALIDMLGDAPAVFPTLWALKVYHHVRSNRDQARELAQRFVDMAERIGNNDQLMAGLPLLAQCRWIEGDYLGARAVLDRALALYDVQAHRSHALMYGLDSLSYSLVTLSQVQWGLGDADGALQLAQQAVLHAQELKHANTIGLAMLYLMMVHQERGERQRVEELGRETLAFCERFGVATPSSYARMIHNWAIGDVDTSLHIIPVHKAIGARLGLTYYMALIAESAAAVGRYDEALALIAECVQQAEQMAERYYLPELHRLRGQVLLLRDPKALAEAQACFEQALAVAQAQGAAMHGLRAGVELHRIWRGQGLHRQADDMLANVLGQLPEPARAKAQAEIQQLAAT